MRENQLKRFSARSTLGWLAPPPTWTLINSSQSASVQVTEVMVIVVRLRGIAGSFVNTSAWWKVKYSVASNPFFLAMGKVQPTKRKSRKGKKKETAEVPAVFIFIFQDAFQQPRPQGFSLKKWVKFNKTWHFSLAECSSSSRISSLHASAIILVFSNQTGLL